jgi:hypothetical protein
MTVGKKMLKITSFISLSALAFGTMGCKGRTIDTSVINSAPVAVAGEDQVAPSDDWVELSGAGSFDADGDDLSYSWAFDHLPEGSGLADKEMPFTRNGSGDAMNTAFAPDVTGTYIVSLVVSDGRDNSNVDFVIITAEAPEARPVAHAGSDIAIVSGELASVDGSLSYDPEGRDLTYNWSFVQIATDSSVTSASFSDNNSSAASNVTFLADNKGVYVVNLVVNNGLADSEPDTVMVTATGDDNAPVANAGEDIEAEDCSHIDVSGSNSTDPDSDPLTYFWELQSKPAESASSNDSFSDRTLESPKFWADIAGTYVLSLSVHDGVAWSAADLVTLTVEERMVNTPPQVTITTLATVTAGDAECVESGYAYACDDCEDQFITLGNNVSISDADNDPYTAHWELISGNGSVSSPDELVTSAQITDIEAVEPLVCESNEFVFELTVTDCTGASTSSSTTVTADCCGVEATN